MNDLKKDVWIKTDDAQWVKFVGVEKDEDDKEDEGEYWFKVVNRLLIPSDEEDEDVESYEEMFNEAVFNIATILVEPSRFDEEDVNRYLKPFGYDSVNDVKKEDELGNVYIQYIAEFISEIDMFNGYLDDEKQIAQFNLNPKKGEHVDMSEAISKVEKLINEKY